MPHPNLTVAYLVADQFGLDSSDTDLNDRSFAGDVIWGGPYGATVTGYEALHAVRRLSLDPAPRRSRRWRCTC